MKWSVVVQATGTGGNARVLTREEVVELADAVAANSGVASGIGESRYGLQLVVEAGSRDEALESAKSAFRTAAASAGLPSWPISYAAAESEFDELADEE